METLDLAVQTLFTEFQEACFKRASLERSLLKEGTYTKKKIKGKEYWYSQRYVKGRPVQNYLGPSNDETHQKIMELKNVRGLNLTLLRQMRSEEQRKASMLRRGGLPSLDALTASILEKLSENLLAYEKGVLIGSFAFAAYSGILGRLFEKGSLKTQDIDIVRDKNIEIGIDETVNIEELLEKEKGFRPVPGLSPKTPPSSFVGSSGIRIDLLTPLRGKPKGIVFVPGIIKAGAQPLRFLDFLIENPIRGVLIGPKGGIPVTVPQPARFAIHKLIVSSYRPTSELAKSKKDLLQAGQLMAALAEEQPHELASAKKEASKRGKKWVLAIRRGMELLPQLE